jgi:hypothetical protein
MKTPAPTLSNRAAARFMRLREIQLREIQLGLRFMCVCAPRGRVVPRPRQFPPSPAVRARSRTFSTSKQLHSLLWSRRALAPCFATGASSKSCSTPFTPSS